MRVRAMQLVDYWVGVPLCWVLSILRPLFDIITLKKKKLPIQNILFIELSEMGSAFIAYSMLQQARNKYPNAKLYFLIFKKNRESCEILKIIPKEQIIDIEDTGFIKFCISTLKTLFKIWSLRIDTVIDMELFSRATAIITFMTFADRRIGFHRYTNEGLYRGKLLTHEVPYNSHQHIALNFLTLLAALESNLNEVPLVKEDLKEQLLPMPVIPAEQDENLLVEQLLHEQGHDHSSGTKIILINPDPGEALPIRGWPLDRFVVATQTLLKEDPLAIAVIIGLGRSSVFAKEFVDNIEAGRCIDLTGKTPRLSTVLALMHKSELLITNDSGPAHLASLANLATVVLFGPETPALYGPLHSNCRVIYAGLSCSPCLSALNHRHTLCKVNKCLQVISVDRVLADARLLLRGVNNQ